MNLKLHFVPALAAFASQAAAIHTSQDNYSADVMQALLTIYTTCQVGIQYNEVVVVQNESTQTSTLSFDFTGIDENCPDLTATIWMEAPEHYDQSTTVNSPDQHDFTLTLTPDQIKNGTFTHDFVTDQVAGTYSYHTSVSIYGYECGLPILDTCTDNVVHFPCNASITAFSAENSINTQLGPADEYYGEEGINHSLNFAFANLEYCQMNVYYEVYDYEMNLAAAGEIGPYALGYYLQSDQNSYFRLQSDTVYNTGYNYHVELRHDSNDTVLEDRWAYLNNPHPNCTLDGTLDITDVSVNSQNQIEIVQAWNVDGLYTCDVTNTSSEISHNDNESELLLQGQDDESVPVEVDLGVPSNSTTVAMGYPEPIWENFPILINSTLSVVANQNESSGSVSADIEANTVEFWPDCIFSSDSTVISYEKQLVANSSDEESAFSAYKLQFNATATSTFNSFCPPASGEFIFYRNGVQVVTQHIKVNETETSRAMIVTSDFADGQWCVDFKVTLDESRVGMVSYLSSTNKGCTTVTADPCLIEAFTTVNGTVDPVTSTTLMQWWANYELNSWCLNGSESLNFTLEFSYMDGEWTTIDDSMGYTDQNPNGVGDVRQQLLDNKSFYYSMETNRQSDVVGKVRFRVDYNGKGSTTQNATSAVAADEFTSTTVCRPIIGVGMPRIYNFVENNDTLDIDFKIMFEPADLAVCGEMKMEIEILQHVNGTNSLVNKVENITELSNYTYVTGLYSAVSAVPDDAACYIVKVLYGEVDDFEYGSVSSMSQKMCYLGSPKVPCVLTPNKPQMQSITADDNKDNLIHNYNVYTTQSGDCENLSGYVQLTDKAGNSWTGEKFFNQTSTTSVIQTSNFNSSNYNVTAYWTSTSKVVVNSSSVYEFFMPDPTVTLQSGSVANSNKSDYCDFDYSTEVAASKDTINKVTIIQSSNSTMSGLCGTSTFDISAQIGTYQAEFENGTDYKAWNLNSTTGQYTFDAYLNFPDYSWWGQAKESSSLEWEQGCVVQILNANIVSFTEGSLEANTSASAQVYLQGQQTGDCGNNFTVKAILDQLDDDMQYTLAVNQAKFFSTTGLTISQDVSKVSSNYSLSVDVVANDAETAEEHQNRTSGEGFTNQLSDSTTTQRYFSGTTCQLDITDFTFEGFEENSDWSSPILASFSGDFRAMDTCTNISATITLYDESGLRVSSIDVSSIIQNGTDYSFDLESLSAPNKNASYYGELYLTDLANDAVPQTANTTLAYWQPPCYPEVVYFEKQNQTDSLDHQKTTLQFGLQLALHGDDACINKTANVQILSSTNNATSFIMRLDENDIQKALDGFFNFSIAIGADEAENAKVTFDTVDAVEPATAFIAEVYTVPADASCEVNVVEFCLLDIAPVSVNETTGVQPYTMTFSLDVEFNSACGNLDGSIDIVADGDYLTQISVDHNQIVNAFDCQCNSTISFEADFDGDELSGSTFYGQLDIRNGQHDIVLITDSCTLDME